MEYYRWLKQAWPFWIVLFLVSVHTYAIIGYGLSTDDVNENVSLIAQLIGGLCVLASIDSQLALVKGSSTIDMFIGWLRKFPLFYKLRIEGGGVLLAFDQKVRRVGSKPVSAPEDDVEKFEVLFQTVNDLKEELNDLRKDVWREVDYSNFLLEKKLKDTALEIEGVDSKLTSMTSGFQLQLFGVYMLVYGLFADYLV